MATKSYVQWLCLGLLALPVTAGLGACGSSPNTTPLSIDGGSTGGTSATGGGSATGAGGSGVTSAGGTGTTGVGGSGVTGTGQPSGGNACTTSGDCTPPRGYCHGGSGTCVECLATANCGAGQACQLGPQTCAQTCSSSTDCTGVAAACDTSSGMCVECMAAGDCDGARSVCNASRECVECLATSDCGGATPVCDTSSQACVECLSTPDCGDGLVCDAGQCICENCSDCGGAQCDVAFETCTDASCECRGGTELCRDQCSDTQNDPKNCGVCDEKCDKMEICTAGDCVCRPGLDLCDTGCFDFQSDADHCGDCTTVCGDGERCDGGQCLSGDAGAECSEGLTACGAGGGKTHCVNVATSNAHCGRCDRECSEERVCVEGECRKYKPAAPCVACPCTAVCDELVNEPGCCVGPNGNAICVERGICP